jgi:CDP-diacylglycerol pyrophosphatase
MIAYAIYMGYEKIRLYGVDMNGKDEYINQRGSVMFWLGIAKASGIEYELSSDIDEPCFLYGYEWKARKILSKKWTP